MRESIDESVLRLAAAGKLTSATLLVTHGPARLPSLAARIRDQGSPAVGLHLDLDAWFRFDETGHYGDTDADIIDDYAAIVDARRDELRRAITEQIAAIRILGLEPTHLDGHHNVHLFPAIRDLVLSIMADRGIARGRLDTSFYRTPEALTEARDAFRSYGISHTDAFLDLGLILHEGTDVLNWMEGTVEIMAHTEMPGTDAESWRTQHHGYLESAPWAATLALTDYRNL